MAGAQRALAGEMCETNEAIARGVTAMVVGSGALLAQRTRATTPKIRSRSLSFEADATPPFFSRWQRTKFIPVFATVILTAR
jgi:hypothetical protein